MLLRGLGSGEEELIFIDEYKLVQPQRKSVWRFLKNF
jgi:hypothetical protein